MVIGHECLGHRKFVLFSNRLLEWDQLDTRQVIDDVIDDLRSITLDGLVHVIQEVIPVKEWLWLLFVELAMVFLDSRGTWTEIRRSLVIHAGD